MRGQWSVWFKLTGKQDTKSAIQKSISECTQPSKLEEDGLLRLTSRGLQNIGKKSSGRDGRARVESPPQYKQGV